MAQNFKILVLNGPNLNLLGTREESIYGKTTLKDIQATLKKEGAKLKADITFHQSNEEGKLVAWIQKSEKKYDGLIINPAAYTHTSVAIRDAILAVNTPTVEVHLSNIYKREEFRHHSFVSAVAIGQIAGFGPHGYTLALMALVNHLKNA
ncbi:type II 3-dehydroquinate dehydratase [bacterium]|nr:type II 3-dehydroquinate dehydratase [bacterium]